jgi:hypothetical protein
MPAGGGAEVVGDNAAGIEAAYFQFGENHGVLFLF